MQTQVHELKEHLARLLDKDDARARLAEAEAAGTRKGISVRGARPRLRSRRSPAPAATSPRIPAASGPRAGARRATRWSRSAPAPAPRQGRIVFEAKDKRLSQERRLDRAQRGDGRARRRSRCSSSPARRTIPSGLEELTEYEGNKLIVAVDRDEPERLALAIAYRLAAARVAMARDRDLRGRRDRGPRRRRRGDQPAEAGAGDPLGADRDQDQLRQGARRARCDGRRAGGEARADRGAGRRRGGRGRGGPLGQAELVLGALALGADDELRDPRRRRRR